MSVAFVQKVHSGSGTAPSYTTAISVNTTAGNALAVNVRLPSGETLSSVTDTKSNTYVVYKTAGTTNNAGLAIALNTTALVGGTDSITITTTGTTGWEFLMDEWSGITSVTNSATFLQASSKTIAGTVTPVNATDQVLATFTTANSSSVLTDPTGFTSYDTSTGFMDVSADLTNNGTAAVGGTWTSSLSTNLSLVLLSVATSGGFRTLMGVGI